MKPNKTLYGVMAVLAIMQGWLHGGVIFPQWRKYFKPGGETGESNVVSQLAPDQIFLSLFGFREFLAGILWVRADGFFDEGNYDAVLPIIRLCTLLDPKQIDIYATGMWHIGYNFTDEDQRSDRRYLPSALALGKEGCRQNPNTYEMFFETGWVWYHKIQDDFPQAVSYFEQAAERKDIQAARRNLLNMAYQRDGHPEKARDLLYSLYKRASDLYEEDPQFGNHQNRDTIEQNLDNTIVRMAQRGWFAMNTPEGKAGRWFEQSAYDVKPPFDVGFTAKVTVVEPAVLRVEGTWNVLPVGTRIRFILRDANYKDAIPGGMQWDSSNEINLDPPKDVTFLQDELYVKNRAFNKRVDMSRDPTMYPLVGDKYVLEFYWNPRTAPPHIQDKFSWSGEGMTDSRFLNTTIRPGQRVIYTSMTLTRDQLRRRGEWSMEGGKVPVVKTDGFKETGKATSKDAEILDIPSLRGK